MPVSAREEPDWHVEWRRKVLDEHAAEVADGEHDDGCEFRPNGHFVCNCSKRRREAEGYTEPPGELIHQYPLCPRCRDEVSHDGDGWYCEPCCAAWDTDGGSATFTDDYGDLTDSLAIHEAREGEGR